MTEPTRTPDRLATARAERRRVDQPREARRVRLPRFDPEVFGRWSEAFARYMGTAKFIVYMTLVIAVWFAWNTLAPRSLRFDPYTFTFLTLILSLQASYAAPLILLAQNRQTERDRIALDEDRRRATMQKADTEYLAREIASLRIALGEVATRDFLRSELNRLVEDLGEAAERRLKQERKETRRLARREAERNLAEHTGRSADQAGHEAAGSNAGQPADPADRHPRSDLAGQAPPGDLAEQAPPGDPAEQAPPDDPQHHHRGTPGRTGCRNYRRSKRERRAPQGVKARDAY